MEQTGTWTRVRPALERPGRLLGLLAVGTALLGVTAGVAIRLLSRTSPAAVVVTSRHGLEGQATWPAGARAAPAIRGLHDQTGRLFSLTSLRGHPVAIVFFDSHCHQECPLEGRSLASAERALPRSQRPVLVAVSVDPLDTAATARRAVRSWGLATAAPWHWLLGRRAELSGVWRPYRIYVAPHPANGDIAHTEAVYLVDRRGFERSAYLFPFTRRAVIHDLRVLAQRES